MPHKKILSNQQISHRIRRLADAMEKVAHGNFTIRIEDNNDDEVGHLVEAFNRMVAQLHDLEESRDLLSRTMSPEVRQVLMEKGLDFRGITQTVSVLFIDIRDFTRITESHHSTEQLVFFLNDYYTTIANQVHIEGGIIGKYAGDSILAYFGAPAPKPEPESSVAALLTALALQEAISELSERWSYLGMPPVRVGIGIGMGPVVAGPIGSGSQFEYSVIGDAVNLASRLQALTRNVPGFHTILSAEVYEALDEKIKTQLRVVDFETYQSLPAEEKVQQAIFFVDLGEVLVKGKKEPVQVYGLPDFEPNG